MLGETRAYGGRTGAQRQDERRTRLREACLDLVGAGGVGAVSLNGVCAAASLAKRYFYESYASREALLADVLELFFRDTEEKGQLIFANAAGSLEDVLGSAIDDLLTTLEADPRKARLYAEASSEPALATVRESAIDTFVSLVLRWFPSRSRPCDEFAVFALVSGVTDALCSWLLQPPPRVPRAEVLEGSVLICAATLQALQS